MSPKTPDVVVIEPPNHDTSAVERVLASSERLDNATRITVVCRTRHHTLARLVKAGGELVFVADRRFERRAVLPDGRAEYVQCLWRHVDFLDASRSTGWEVTCLCGPGAAVARRWLLAQYRQSRGRPRRLEVDTRAGTGVPAP
ncbi:MAG TPA: hypothetical protein VMB72_06290 [Acidimicrobiales bacterium]|nr:hypothetical protein [Acidimicrobiales bacterium]